MILMLLAVGANELCIIQDKDKSKVMIFCF